MKKYVTIIMLVGSTVFLYLMSPLVCVAEHTVLPTNTQNEGFFYGDDMRTCEIEGCDNKHKAKGLCEKHYFQQYAITNKEKISEHQKLYRRINKKKKSEYNKEYRLKNKKKITERDKQYKEVNKEKIGKRNKKYCQENKEKIAKRSNLWRRTPQGKLRVKVYHGRHRQLGFIPLNKPFPGCHGHHVDKERVIYIPEEMHKSIWHSLTKNINMDKINKLAFGFFGAEKKGENDGREKGS